MSSQKRLVLDANILLRAVLGVRVLNLLNTYQDAVSFYSPDVCFDDARKYIYKLGEERNFDSDVGLILIDQLSLVIEIVGEDFYRDRESVARKRISSRDAADWPIIAAALVLQCPVWTEDRDFFGCGIATWTTTNVEQYFRDA